MEKLILICLVFISLNSTAQNVTIINKAHQNVAAYMKKNLNDPDSYKPVNFYGLIKIFSTPDTQSLAYYFDQQILLTREAMINMDTVRRRRVIALNNYALIEKDSIYLRAKKFVKDDKDLINEIERKKIIAVEKMKLNYQPQLTGYTMRHFFRARNSFNALILSSWNFTLSKSGDIIGVETRSYDQQMQDLKDEYRKTNEKLQNP